MRKINSRQNKLKVLIVKTSSMGDILHTLPAITDAAKSGLDIYFDWVVEAPFAEIPRWHPNVEKVIISNIRRWRKNLFSTITRHEIAEFYKTLRKQKYDIILDAQGLLKSAVISFLAHGKRVGFAKNSIKEKVAAYSYQRKYQVSKDQHAIWRTRKLFSQALGYLLTKSEPDYGVDLNLLKKTINNNTAPYLVFLHATTWDTKHWSQSYWRRLTELAISNGFIVKLPWGNEQEKLRANEIAKNLPSAEVLPKLNLSGIAQILAGAKAFVAVDTGLGHMAAALRVPGISLYGPTSAKLSGAQGINQQHISASYPECAPCFERNCLRVKLTKKHSEFKSSSSGPDCLASLSPELIWGKLTSILK